MERQTCYIKFRHDECLRFFHEFRYFWKVCQPIPLLQRDSHHTYVLRKICLIHVCQKQALVNLCKTPCIWFLKSIAHELDFWTLSISNLIFTACVACQNLVQNRQKNKFKNKFKNQVLEQDTYFKTQVQINTYSWFIRRPL